MSKHEDIIKHIASLTVGTKISVRSIASELNVSDGTAYRAIKDAENIGIVSTIPRVGTVRVEKVDKRNIEKLNCAEVVNIVGGTILGGKDGLYKTLNNFIIGAMTIDAMKKYIVPGNLLIVGNREEAHKLALENGCSVLITGGFGCSDEIKALANENNLPIISCTNDTFSTATMINKALSETMIKKDIILVEDIMRTDFYIIRNYNTVGQLKKLAEESTKTKFPVLDENDKLVGIITLKDIGPEVLDSEVVSRCMTKEPITVDLKTSVAYAAHLIIKEGVELVPVLESRRLVGVVSRQGIVKALQYINRQPQGGDTIDDLIMSKFSSVSTDHGITFQGKILPEMLSAIGTASWSVLTHVMSTAGITVLKQRNHLNVAVDSLSIMFAKPVQIDSIISVTANIIDIGKNTSKVEIEMLSGENEELISKGLLSAKIIRK
jgi:predicted transcriptional regulator